MSLGRRREKGMTKSPEAGRNASAEPRLLRACRLEPVDRIPVWFMRQAGRYLPEYRKVREQVPFLTLCKTPDLAAEVTLQPVERFGMDGAVLFSDILLLLEAMGAAVSFEEEGGPKVQVPLNEEKDLERLGLPDPEVELRFMMDAIRSVRRSLSPEVALLGFSGAPFTLATYLVEGGSSRDFRRTKILMYREPRVFRRLMDLLVKAVAECLEAQVRAGAQAVQVFDTWAVTLSPGDYRTYVLPFMQELLGRLKGIGAPVLHFSLGTSTLLESMAEIGAQVLSLDWKIQMGAARARLGERQAVQGNLDPSALFKLPEALEAEVLNILREGSEKPGYIFNLGHGIHPATPLESVYRVVETVRSFRLEP